MIKKILLILAVMVLGLTARAMAVTNSQSQSYSGNILRDVSGTATITTTSAVWTGYTALITITPATNFALEDVIIVVDLDKTTTGFASTYTTGTATFSLARKVDGTNYRTATNLASGAIVGDNADGLSVEFRTDAVGPSECLQLRVKVSAESNSNTSFPFKVYYKSGAEATVTPAS